MAELPNDLEFLKDSSLDPDIKKALLDKVFEEKRFERERAKDEETRHDEKNRFWHNTPLVVALTGAITIAANALSGAFLDREGTQNKASLTRIEAALAEQGKGADANRQASNEERQFAFRVIERELAKSNEMAERAGVLLFLVRSGILNGLNRDELEEMALNDLEKSGSDSESVGIPATLGALNYQLDVPVSAPGQTVAARSLLEISTREINKNIEETTHLKDLERYWSVVHEFDGEITPQLPWSAAFISWAIAQTGNPDGLQLSAANFKIWKSAVEKGCVIGRLSKVLPGDLIFIARTKEQVTAVLSGGGEPMQTGVVYSVEKEKGLKYIGGNIGNAVRLREIALSDGKIVGFVRIGQKGISPSTGAVQQQVPADLPASVASPLRQGRG